MLLVTEVFPACMLVAYIAAVYRHVHLAARLHSRHAGLSGAVFTSLYVGFLQPDTLAFLLFIAVTPTVVVLIAACFVNFVPFVQDREVATDTGATP